jgi:hypothetical protein
MEYPKSEIMIAEENLKNYITDTNLLISLAEHFNQKTQYESLMQIRKSTDWELRKSRKGIR